MKARWREILLFSFIGVVCLLFIFFYYLAAKDIAGRAPETGCFEGGCAEDEVVIVVDGEKWRVLDIEGVWENEDERTSENSEADIPSASQR